MADLTLAQLLAARTLDQIRERLFARLNVAGFPITDFHSGGVERTSIEAAAEAIRDFVAFLLPVLAGGGLATEAAGDWLSLLGAHNYRLDRTPAEYTIQNVKLMVAPGAGPYPRTAGDLVVRAASGNRYILETGVTLPAGGVSGDFVWGRFKAESPGSAYSDAAGTITELVTSLPGVSVSNAVDVGSFTGVAHAGTGSGTMSVSGTPTVSAARFTVRILIGGAAGTATFEYSHDGGPWLTGGVTQIAPAYTTIAVGVRVGFTGPLHAGDTYVFATPGSSIAVQGRDLESDEDYRARIIARWPALAEVGLSEIYELWAKEASPDVTQVTVTPGNSALTPGRVNILIAGFVNPLSGGTVTAVQNYISERAPITAVPVVTSASPEPIAVAGSVTVRSAELVTVQENAQALWDAYLRSLPMGEGTVIRVAELAQALMDAGAVDFDDLRIGGPSDITYERVTLIGTTIATGYVNPPTITGIKDMLTWVLI